MMRETILELLGFNDAATKTSSAAGTQAVREIVEALDRLEPDRARHVAAFAYLLGRIAHADLEISKAETRTMERVVVEHAGLPEEQAILVVQIAKTQARLFGGTENFLVAREFDELASRTDKLALLDCLFAVAAADDGISSAEDSEIARIAKQMKLSHEELVEIRGRYRDHLAFRNPA